MRAFDVIIPFLSNRVDKAGGAILFGSHERVPLKKEAFQSLKPATGPRLVFVDSGSGRVLAGPSVCVDFVRLYSCWYEDNVRVDRELREFFLVVSAFQKGLDLGFEVVLFDLNGLEKEKFSFDAFDPVLCFGGRRAEPSAVVSYVRKLLELRFVDELCNKLSKDDVIVRDGDLEARGDLMETVWHSLRVSSQRKGVVVLGLAKTSVLCTDSGNSALVALRKIAPSGSWFYYTGGSVGFVKLHPSSKYVFRCDVMPFDRDSLPKSWSALAANAEDPAFLGYPYGLVDADKFAQVAKDELSQLRARFAVQSKEVFSSVESALDAHDLLNSF
ncbi:hypothetical protein KY309_02290 [Candidatus Woesearchaeota archaeon]|nr:hypothetical protein [Candidatus Woesearchaeota archaeon]MBW3016416.1 hypothetical protein [Candidatus Woesearchaeota archaeon]